MSEPHEPLPSARRPFRLPSAGSMTVVAVVLTLVCVVGYFGWPIYQQHALVSDIEQSGGEVATDQVGPEWLRSHVDEKWFKGVDRVAAVALTSPEFGDQDVARVSGLAGLQLLTLQSKHFTDEGLMHLSAMTGLRVLYLDSPQITDEGLKRLSGLTGLKILGLWSAQVTDDDVAELQRRLPHCKIMR